MAEEKFVIHGGKPLNGVVESSGYKNSAGPCLAATLLTKEDCIVDNLPLVKDVLNMIEILKDMGAEVEWLDKKKIRINNTNLNPQNINPEKFSKSRISVLLMGPLLARFKNFEIPHPGGDRIGIRPITTHLQALEKLGAEIIQEENFYKIRSEKLSAKDIVLKEISVTGTENLMMAATLTSGTTRIIGAAAEPQVQDLGEMLKKMGSEIHGLGAHIITIKGKDELKGVSHKIIPDWTEVGTLITAACITPGQVEIRNIDLSHLDLFLDKLEEIGVNFKKGENSILVDYSPNLKGAKVQALPYPSFQTDLLPIISVLLTQAKGKSLIHDPLYDNRFGHLQEFKKMGADIELVDPHRALIFGKTPLKGLNVESWDIRAGASLVIAGLLAEGQTTLNNIYQIDRGYERIEKKLKGLGAQIERVTDQT